MHHFLKKCIAELAVVIQLSYNSSSVVTISTLFLAAVSWEMTTRPLFKIQKGKKMKVWGAWIARMHST